MTGAGASADDASAIEVAGVDVAGVDTPGDAASPVSGCPRCVCWDASTPVSPGALNGGSGIRNPTGAGMGGEISAVDGGGSNVDGASASEIALSLSLHPPSTPSSGATDSQAHPISSLRRDCEI